MPPPPATRLGEIKRAPVPRLLLRWVYVIGLGMNENVQNTAEHMPSFFLGVDFIVFWHFFLILSPHKGSAVFLNIGLTQTCIATAVPPPPHMGTLPKLQEGDKKMQSNS